MKVIKTPAATKFWRRWLPFLIIPLISFTFLSPLVCWSEQVKPGEELELVFFNPDTSSKNPIDATNALQTFLNIINRQKGWNLRAYYFKKQKDLERFLGSRKVEFGILSQMFIAENYKRFNLFPIASPVRNGATTYRQVIVVHKESGIHELQDLKGKTLAVTALGEENMPFYNKVLFRGEISVQDHFKYIQIVDSVSSAILAVLYRQCDAAAVTLTSFRIAKELNPQIAKNILGIFTSEKTPISPLCYFAANVSDNIAEQLFKSIEFQHLDPVGMQSLLAFNVEAWTRTDLQPFLRIEKLLLKKQPVSKLRAPSSPPAVQETSETGTSKVPDRPRPLFIHQISVKRLETSVVEISADVFPGDPPEQDISVSVVYTLGDSEQKRISLEKVSENHYQVTASLPALSASLQEEVRTYTVRAGDTLGKIAQRQLGTSTRYMLIASYNNISNPHVIYIGQVLKIPALKQDVRVFRYQIEVSTASGKTIRSKTREKVFI